MAIRMAVKQDYSVTIGAEKNADHPNRVAIFMDRENRSPDETPYLIVTPDPNARHSAEVAKIRGMPFAYTLRLEPQTMPGEMWVSFPGHPQEYPKPNGDVVYKFNDYGGDTDWDDLILRVDFAYNPPFQLWNEKPTRIATFESQCDSRVYVHVQWPNHGPTNFWLEPGEIHELSLDAGPAPCYCYSTEGGIDDCRADCQPVRAGGRYILCD